MYQSDWLLRQIEQMGDVLRRLVAALREQRPDDAVTLSRSAVGELLGTDPDLIDALSGDGLVTMLSARGRLLTAAAQTGTISQELSGQLGQCRESARALGYDIDAALELLDEARPA